jgi:hypothetical protein
MKSFFQKKDFFFLILVLGLGFGVSIPYIVNPRQVLGIISFLMIGFALVGMMYLEVDEITKGVLKWLVRKSQKNVS